VVVPVRREEEEDEEEGGIRLVLDEWVEEAFHGGR